MFKNYNESVFESKNTTFIIKGPVSPAEIDDFTFCPTLDNFREPVSQKEALKSIAATEPGRIYIATTGNTIVGYVTVHEYHPLSQFYLPGVLELGGIEISKHYRSFGLAKRLMEYVGQDEDLEHFILAAMEYFWHWDLKTSNIDIWTYRNILFKVFAKGGFESMFCDDPEICSHPVNAFMVRHGSKVEAETHYKFELARNKHNCFTGG